MKFFLILHSSLHLEKLEITIRYHNKIVSKPTQAYINARFGEDEVG